MNYNDRLTETGVTIFLMHGVVVKSDYTIRNYSKKHLDKDYFYHFLLSLKQAGCPLSMDDIVHHHYEREPFPPRAFAITFDDAFENNYSVAAPILAELNIPATFYLTTGFIDNNAMSWIDRIEYCLETVPRASLSFAWDGTTHVLKSVTDKIRFLDYLRSHVKRDKTIDLDELVSSVFSQCGVAEVRQSSDPLDLKMTWDNVREMIADKLFTFGGHSHHHVNLSFLRPKELGDEVATSISRIQEETHINPRHYSYPEGLDYCYSDEVIRVLRSNGIICSPTAIDGVNGLGTDLFHLRRITVV